MKKISQLISIVLLGLSIFFGSCQQDYEAGDLTAPTNLQVSFEIVGATAEEPAGDGSGEVRFNVTADNYINFTFDFDDGQKLVVSPSGNLTKKFTANGTNLYNVKVSAVGSGGISSSTTVPMEVRVDFFPEEEINLLTGGSSKTWYWAADQPAHIGLGPTNKLNPADPNDFRHTYPDFFQIGPWDEEKSCMYPAEFVFTLNDTKVTFEQTTGPAFIPGTYAGTLGIDGDRCYGDDVVTNLYGEKNVAFFESTSTASVDGEYLGVSFTLSDDGTMSWWVGASTYDIIELTENTLRVRITENDEFSWYQILVSERPVQP